MQMSLKVLDPPMVLSFWWKYFLFKKLTSLMQPMKAIMLIRKAIQTYYINQKIVFFFI